MSQTNVGFKTFEASGLFPQNARVKLLANGTVQIANSGEQHIGTALRESFASGDAVSVSLLNRTVKMIASEQINAGDKLVGTQDGKVALAGDYPVGIAMESVSGDGSIVEVMPLSSTDSFAFEANVKLVTSNYASLITDRVLLVDATSGDIDVNLPAAATSAGVKITLKKTDGTTNNVSVASADLIDGFAHQTITLQYDALSCVCNGATWFLV